LLINRILPGFADKISEKVSKPLQKEKDVTLDKIDLEMKLALVEFIKQYTKKYSDKCTPYFKKTKEQREKSKAKSP
jgi:hypothetical protein